MLTYVMYQKWSNNFTPKYRKSMYVSAKHCNTMQHTAAHATHCNTLQHAATRCNTLQHAVTRCNTLQHTEMIRHYHNCWIHCLTPKNRMGVFISARHCNTLQYTATHCNTLQHTATHCNTLQHTAAHCSTKKHIELLRLFHNCWIHSLTQHT